jgi:hypothetical protein
MQIIIDVYSKTVKGNITGTKTGQAEEKHKNLMNKNCQAGN